MYNSCMNTELSPGVRPHFQEGQKGQEGPNPRHLLYIPGLSVTHSDIAHTVGPLFIGKWGGPENVTLLNSAVSTDPHEPDRLERMDASIINNAKNGMDIVVGSLGATELWKSMKRIKKSHPGFFDDPDVINNTRIVLIGPSGFAKGVKEKIRYAKSTIVDINGPEEKGREALATFPPTDSEVPSAKLANKLSPHSNIREGFTLLPDTEVNLNREGNFTSAELEILTAYNEELSAAVMAESNEEFDAHIRKRGAAVQKGGDLEAPMRRVYNGTDAPADLSPLEMLKQPALMLRAGGKYPMEEFSRMLEKGYQIDFVVPQYDTAFPIQKVIDFFGSVELAREHTFVTSIGNHPSLHAQPASFGIGPKPHN